MAEILTVALYAEGPTDYRFLVPIIRRTISEIILNSEYTIELYDILEISKETENSYTDEILTVSKKAFKSGMKCLLLHCDADSRTNTNVMQTKITPALSAINSDGTELCENITPIIPVQMTEAWMLADVELLKSEINATKISDSNLGLTRTAESYADPKQVIKDAILIAQQETTRRHRTLDISELYTLLGNKISLDKLKQLPSYKYFYKTLKDNCLPYC